MNAKTLRQCFSVALTCWSMLLTTIPSLGYAQSSNNKPMTAAECTGSAHQWNSQLNRCMLKGESTAQREMFEQCDAKEGSERARCFEEMRNKNLNSQAVNDCKAKHGNDTKALTECMSQISGDDDGMADKYKDSGMSFLGLGINATVTALAVANMLSKSGKKAKGCTSATMLKFVGIGALAGQAYLKFGAKGDFKKLEKNYDEQVASGDDAQFAAYDYLEAQQNEIVSVAKKHEKVYGMTALGYGATAVVAGLESMGGVMGGLKPCTGESAGESADNADGDADTGTDTAGQDSPSSDNVADNTSNTDPDVDYEEPTITDAERAEIDAQITPEQRAEGYAVADNGVVQKSHVEPDGRVVVTALRNQPSIPSAVDTATSEVAKTGIFSKITNFLSTSPGILTLSLAGGLINTFLKNKAGKQKEEAQENAEKVANLRAKLQEALAGANYCPTRDDLSKPRCYCYSSDGSRNSNRSKSETCQALWANQDRNLYAEAGSYGRSNKQKSQGCYTLTGQWDPDCKCRNMKDDKGANACMQVPVGVNSITALGPQTGVPQVIDSYNKLFSGGLANGELQPAQIQNLAARSGAARKAVLAKLDSKNGTKSAAGFEAQSMELLKALSKRVPVSELAQAGLAAQPLSGGNTPNSPALTDAMKKAGISIASVNRSAPSKARKSSSKKKAGFDIYSTGDKKETAYMDKNYNYQEAQQDIVEREDVSIWQVISNRYTVTGLKRLFDDDAEGL